MAITEGIGTVLAVSAALPATFDQVGYEALSFTDVGEISEIPEHGANHDLVTFADLKTGVQRKLHGIANYGSLSVPVAYDPADAGQDILRAAVASKDEIAVKITYSDGSVTYVGAKILSFTRRAVATEVLGGTCQIELTRSTISVDPA